MKVIEDMSMKERKILEYKKKEKKEKLAKDLENKTRADEKIKKINEIEEKFYEKKNEEAYQMKRKIEEK